MLFTLERFCSINAAAKLVEEGPWLSDEKRQEIGELVCGAEPRLQRVSNLNFLEILMATSFLEVNPRVQVEHTVTELITGYNLVELGIRVAQERIYHYPNRIFHGGAMQFNAV